ncbi:prenyltransferase [Micromonospora sp. NPDC003197]
MSTDNLIAEWAPPTEAELVTAAGELVTGLVDEPWGQASPSVYETGRLIALAPWLTGHAGRVRYLMETQRPDGGWGQPDGYGLVPTLSATEALFVTLRQGADPGPNRADLVSVVDRGLRALVRWLADPALSVPDTPAADLIVPDLVNLLNTHLNELHDTPIVGLDPAWAGVRLGLPARMDSARLTRVRQGIAVGAQIPEKLLHALETVGEAARGAPGVTPVPPGTVGASPAATAAWLGGPEATGPARSYLDMIASQQGGPVPCATPITVFERGWVLSTLARARVPVTPPADLVRSLRAALRSDGAPAGPGLPADADTSSVALYALAQLGQPIAPDCLWSFDTGAHFCTWPGEDGYSITTNAHVLDVLGHHLVTGPTAPERYRATVERLANWLCVRQRPDGAWADRWHASPYYATVCCVLALQQHGRGGAVSAAISRAVDWVLGSQRADGSWGRWTGTAEETAYALQVLATAGRPGLSGLDAALTRGRAYLLSPADGTPLWLESNGTPLWHDKDLYLPAAIVRSAVLAALVLTARRLESPR